MDNAERPERELLPHGTRLVACVVDEDGLLSHDLHVPLEGLVGLSEGHSARQQRIASSFFTLHAPFLVFRAK
ncbi:hypothetical protein GQ600_13357 [Phytophthora cactorum]|nr:hypothetical protein GQ600_13357 [Phytophthora cactorum]